MKVQGIGIDIPDNQVDGRRQVLIDTLKQARAAGFTLAELSIPSLNVIMNGELIPERVAAIQASIAPFDLRFSVHAPGRTNLAFSQDLGLEYRVLEACVRFCHAIGAPVLVLITADCRHWRRREPGQLFSPTKLSWRAGRSARWRRCKNWRESPANWAS